MPMETKEARDEFKRIIHAINKDMSGVYRLEDDIAMLILKYCDPVILKKKLKGLVTLE